MSDALLLEAIERFQSLLERARQLDMKEPDAVALATADRRGRPSVRIVLLRGCDARGFVFYTNSHSDKGRQLAENPHAALCFYWDLLREQVRVEGRVEPVSDEESDAYWSRRPRPSQLAAAASEQSSLLPDRQVYEQRVAKLELELAGREVARPKHWFGYRVAAQRIEFWQGRENRMHNRTVYEETPHGWTRYFLYP